jgi:hypothetical protein
MKNLELGLIFICTVILLGCHAKTKISNVKYCESFPDLPRPKWTVDPELTGYFVGVGVSNYQSQGEKYQRDLTYQDAVNDLASSLVTKVTSSMELRTTSEWGDVNNSSEIYSKLLSEITLENIKVEAWWPDRTSCQLWSIVKLDRDKGEEIILNYYSQEKRNSEIAFWNQIKNSNKVADFENYLALYNDGLYLRLAQKKIDLITNVKDEELFYCNGVDTEFDWRVEYQIILTKEGKAFDGISGRQFAIKEINPAYISLIDRYKSFKGLLANAINNEIELKINRLSNEFIAYYLGDDFKYKRVILAQEIDHELYHTNNEIDGKKITKIATVKSICKKSG